MSKVIKFSSLLALLYSTIALRLYSGQSRSISLKCGHRRVSLSSVR